MRYMLLVYGSRDRRDPDSPEAKQRIAAHRAFTEECRARGVLIAAEPLQPVDTATTVRVREGKTLMTDGPFAETHEYLAGYYLLDCRDLDEALELAAKVPVHETGSIEVRPTQEVPAA